MNDCLLEFLRTGRLGTICLGLSSDDLRRELGEPNDVHFQCAGNPADDSIWLFGSQESGNLQILLKDKRVTGIWLYLWGSRKVDSLPSVFSANNWQINGRTSIKTFTKILDRHKINWKTHAPLTFDSQHCLILESDVHVLWSLEGHKGLEKIMLTQGSARWTLET